MREKHYPAQARHDAAFRESRYRGESGGGIHLNWGNNGVRCQNDKKHPGEPSQIRFRRNKGTAVGFYKPPTLCLILMNFCPFDMPEPL